MRPERNLISLIVCLCCCVAPSLASPTPNPQLPVFSKASQLAAGDASYHKFRERQFVAFNPRFKLLRAERINRARRLAKRVFAQEAQGQDTTCAHQILMETAWLISNTADFARIDERLHDLQQTLAHPRRELLGRQQNPADGSWGRCYTEWFFKLDGTFDHLNKASTRNKPLKIPLRFLDRVNSPEKLRSYFTAVSVSDIARQGVDRRRQLNESMADLLRFLLRNQPKGYFWKPGVKATMMDLVLNYLRNARTGWWGERYVRDGKVEQVDDLSMTFHMIRYLNGNVPDMRNVVDTALAVRNCDYPVGWLEDGHYTNHNNMDAAVLFKFGWNFATEAQKKAMAGEIDKMLGWCLSDSLQPDGSFRLRGYGSDSVEESNYFGVTFLTRIGFFDESRRFWTHRDFPQAAGIRQRLIGYITQHIASGAAGGTYYEHALAELGVTPDDSRH